MEGEKGRRERETVFDLSVNIPWRRAVGFIKTNWNDNEEGERRCNDIENGRMKLQRFKYWPPENSIENSVISKSIYEYINIRRNFSYFISILVVNIR